jgi:4-azaleucine resistance transporter AzlC
MSSLWRTADRGLLRDVGALIAAASIIGVSFGAIAVASGLPVWVVVAMSLLIFAGGSQFMALGMLAAGSPVGAALGGLLLNARHLPFGFAVAGVVGRRWPARLLGSHLMIDESVAFALAKQDPTQRRAAYWFTGAGLFLAWNLGTGLGALLGSAAGEPATLGLDAAFPAGLMALVLPSLRDPAARRVAVVGVMAAVLATPLLPPGLPVLLSLVGLTTVMIGRRPRRPRPATPVIGGEDRAVVTNRAAS